MSHARMTIGPRPVAPEAGLPKGRRPLQGAILVWLAGSLACGNGTPNAAAQRPAGSAASEAAAASAPPATLAGPASGPAGAPPLTAPSNAPPGGRGSGLRSGSITGTVAVPANAPGPATVAAALSLGDLATMQAEATAPVGPDGRFRIGGLAPGAYLVAASIDANRDGVFDRRVEPYVLWPHRVPVDGLSASTGIALSNFINVPKRRVRTPERQALIAEMRAGAETALQALLQADLPASANPQRLLPSLRVMLADCDRLWAIADGESTWEFVSQTLAAIPQWALAAKQGTDPLADRRGWQVLGFVRPADRGVIPYLLYVPPDYDPGEPLPLMLALHGGGGSHWSGAHMVIGNGGLKQFGPDRTRGVWPDPPPARMLVVAPMGDRSGSVVPWRLLGEANALGAVEQVMQSYAVDRDRVYLTGLSDGGRGAWEIGVRYPDRFAAILVGAGATDTARYLCMNLAHIPIRVIHGTHDQIIPVAQAREMVQIGRQYNMNIEYQEVDRGHDIADICYGDGAAFAWLGQFARHRVPPVVRFRTESVAYNEGAGLVITQGGPPDRTMDVQVAWSDPGHVRVDTRNVPALTLRVPPGPEAGAITIQWNGQTLQVEGRPAGIALRAAVDPGGHVQWSARPVGPLVAAPLGPWAVFLTG